MTHRINFALSGLSHALFTEHAAEAVKALSKRTSYSERNTVMKVAKATLSVLPYVNVNSASLYRLENGILAKANPFTNKADSHRLDQWETIVTGRPKSLEDSVLVGAVLTDTLHTIKSRPHDFMRDLLRYCSSSQNSSEQTELFGHVQIHRPVPLYADEMYLSGAFGQLWISSEEVGRLERANPKRGKEIREALQYYATTQ